MTGYRRCPKCDAIVRLPDEAFVVIDTNPQQIALRCHACQHVFMVELHREAY